MFQNRPRKRFSERSRGATFFLVIGLKKFLQCRALALATLESSQQIQYRPEPSLEGAKVAQWKRSGGTEFLPFTQIKRTPKADELREVVIRLGVCKSDVQIVPVRLCQDVCLLKRQRAVEDAIVQGHC